MPDSQLSLPQPAHQNHQLFSDHYLNEILPQQGGWGQLARAAAPVLADIAGIFARFTPSENERQTEENLVCPVLRALGHTFELQAPLNTPDGIKVPDYVFYRDAAALAAQKNRVLTEEAARAGALAIGDAKYWQRPLDSAVRTRGADALSNKNPAYQIYFYMLHSGVAWGILTNGKLWRLYQRDSAHKLDIYYEVDLEELVHAGHVERFLYFYAFFRRAAFDDGPLCLAELLRASVDYAHGVGNTLKSQVYDALRHLAQGFLDYAGNALADEPETLKAVYDNALILLYRLIFILYAEARELLPLRESDIYRDSYSLLAIKQAVATQLAQGKRLLPTSARLWPQLKELFTFINIGEPPLHIATFNGGLFDPVKHPFLERYSVGDAHLQQAIDMLARVDGHFIDYRDLTVRHMGTIYEGLLEFKLVPLPTIDHQDQGKVSRQLDPQLFPTSHPQWSIDLITDKGERKASGSYYTPDYIVKFIVEHTVGPALREAVAGKASDSEQLRAVLGVNVLDPAMGSGHFLVEATEYIARYLVDLGIVPEGKTAEEADLAYWKRRVVQSCIYGVDLNPLAVELAKLSLWLITVAKDRPLSFLDHHLRPGNSLVGARLADLQQHSSAGTRVARRNNHTGKTRESAENGEQASLFNSAEFAIRMSAAVSNMWQIEQSEALSVEQVKEQEVLYADLRRHLTEKYGKLADVLTAQHFGVEIPPAQWGMLIDYVQGRSLGLPPALQAIPARVAALAARERFFHWELEFPEHYFDRFGRPLGDDGGFEAVIGNPPYVRQEQLASYKPYFQHYFRAFHGVADLYLYFYERAVEVARRHGRVAFISSGTFARANFAAPFRQWLPGVAQLETLIDFGENQPFPEAEMVRPSIVVMRKEPMTEGFRSLFLAEKIPESLETALAEQGVECAPAVLAQSEWIFQAAASLHLMQKIMAAGRPLQEVVEGRMYYGVKTGLNEAFIIDDFTHHALLRQDPSCDLLMKQLLRGEDLRPWYQEDEGRWLIAIPCGWTRNTFAAELPEEDAWRRFVRLHPALAQHLLPFAGAARARCDQGEYWWELRPCAYYQEFAKPKIFWPDIAKLPRFSRDEAGKYINDKGSIIISDDYALLGMLQSRVLWFVISQLCVPLRLRARLWQYQLKSQFITRLPIPDSNPDDREALGALAEQITALARTRYTLHQRVRHRLLTDQGTHNLLRTLNQKLTAWWELDFTALRAELHKVFKRDIAVRERDEWEAWFAEQRAEHGRLTGEMVAREIALNARVYALFALTTEEIAIVEGSTKYRDGEGVTRGIR